MMEPIGIFIAQQVAGYAISKGLDRYFEKKPKEAFENRLALVINKTIDEFSVKYPTPDEKGKFPFYKSKIIIAELLKYRFFKKDDYNLDSEKIKRELDSNPNIIPPKKETIEAFLVIFEENIRYDEELKEYAIEGNYKAEIFVISETISSQFDVIILMLKEIIKQIKYQSPRTESIPKELTSLIRIKKENIVGRKEDLNNLRSSLLEGKATALINGMGGIGKTTLAAYYVETFFEEYSHIAWITIDSTLEEAVWANYSLKNNLNIENVETEYQVRACLNVLRNLKGEKSGLLIIDNAKEDIRDYYDMLPKAPGWHTLLTSRERIDTFFIIDLDFLLPEDAAALFKKHCAAYTDEQIDKIVEHIDYHTLTIEVLAKSAQNNRWEYEFVFKALAIDAGAGVNIPHKKDGTIERIKSYLIKIFEISKMDEREKWILKRFTAMPDKFIEYKLLLKLLSVQNLDWNDQFAGTLENLYKKGFLLKEAAPKNEDDKYKLHSVLAEALIPQLNTSPEDIESLTEVVASLLSYDLSKDNPIDMFPYAPYGEAILKLFPETDAPEISLLKNNLATVYKDLGDYGKARDLLEAALESDLLKFGEKHPRVAISQSNLALVYQALGEYDKARDLLEVALKSDLQNFNEKHPRVALSQSNLALVYQDLGDYDKARDLLEAALESDLLKFGEKHPRVAISQSNLALVYQDLGDYDKARDLLEAALESDLLKFGEKHPNVAISQSNLAIVYKALGDYNIARELFSNTLRIHEDIYEPNHPHIAQAQSNLATVYKDLGDYEKARDLLEAALESDLQNFGEKHTTVAISQSNLATVYQALGDYDKARDLLEAALESDLQNFGDEHPSVARSQSNLATVYQALGDYDKARELWLSAYSILKDSLGSDHPNTKILAEYIKAYCNN